MAAMVWYVPGWMRTQEPQDFQTIEHSVVDGGVWWNVLAEYKGRKLEQHRLTTHCRILTPEHKCVAWGGKDEMAAAFEKVQLQIGETR